MGPSCCGSSGNSKGTEVKYPSPHLTNSESLVDSLPNESPENKQLSIGSQTPEQLLSRLLIIWALSVAVNVEFSSSTLALKLGSAKLMKQLSSGRLATTRADSRGKALRETKRDSGLKCCGTAGPKNNWPSIGKLPKDTTACSPVEAHPVRASGGGKIWLQTN